MRRSGHRLRIQQHAISIADRRSENQGSSVIASGDKLLSADDDCAGKAGLLLLDMRMILCYRREKHERASMVTSLEDED
jgi:hypothetical protein